MEDDRETLRADKLVELMTAKMTRMQFLTLAAAFGRIDRNAALDTLNIIDAELARGLFAMRDEIIETGGADHMLAPVAERLRETVKLARQEIAKASQPH